MSAEVVPAHRRLLLRGALLRVASDERLVSELRAGSDRAFEVLFDRHYRPLLGFCRQLLGSVEEAEDAVQHTFLAAYRDLVASQKPIVARPWLYTIARHRCLSVLRARHDHPVADPPEPATRSLDADVGVREDLRALIADLGRLPEEQRAALVLMELGDLSHEDIAAVLGCPRDKVKSLVFMARSSLTTSRAARDTPCLEFREQLAVPQPGGLTQAAIRRHLRVCSSCHSFRADLRAQRRNLALLLPVIASPGLRGSVLAAVFGGSGGTGGVAITGALVGGDLAAKALVAAAVVAGATTIAPADRLTATAPEVVAATHRPLSPSRPPAVRALTAPAGRSSTEQLAGAPDTDRPSNHRQPITARSPASEPQHAAAPGHAHTNGRAADRSDEADRARAPEAPEVQNPPKGIAEKSVKAETGNPDRSRVNAAANGENGKPAKPVQEAKPERSGKPVAAPAEAKPDPAAKPEKPGRPAAAPANGKPEKSAKPVQAAKAEKPGKPVAAPANGKSAKPVQPEKPGKPVAAPADGKSAKPVQAEKPEKPGEPLAAPPSAKPVEPARPPKPKDSDTRAVEAPAEVDSSGAGAKAAKPQQAAIAGQSSKPNPAPPDDKPVTNT